jgi:16S rRNA A1518/A1519 N6-dimethyltransferase RsmA/KsgA/DIM1 with predicted DNA glycosylase/AP lyase activity
MRAQVLHTRYPDMMAVDIDQRAIQLLTESLPGLNLVHSDVLQIDYTQVKHHALSYTVCSDCSMLLEY